MYLVITFFILLSGCVSLNQGSDEFIEQSEIAADCTNGRICSHDDDTDCFPDQYFYAADEVTICQKFKPEAVVRKSNRNPASVRPANYKIKRMPAVYQQSSGN